MRCSTTDAVPLWSLVCEHAEVGINHKIDDLISRRHVETIAEPVHCQVSRCHGIEQEILQVLQGLRGVEKCFVCHVDIIGTGSDALGSIVWHLANWLPRPTSLYHLAGKCSHTASQSNCSNWPTFCSGSWDSTMEMISSINCSLAMSISSLSIVINLQTFDRKVLENHVLILHGVLDTNARDLPCVW